MQVANEHVFMSKETSHKSISNHHQTRFLICLLQIVRIIILKFYQVALVTCFRIVFIGKGRYFLFLLFYFLFCCYRCYMCHQHGNYEKLMTLIQ